jgi:hypothetical protein
MLAKNVGKAYTLLHVWLIIIAYTLVVISIYTIDKKSNAEGCNAEYN